MIFDRRPLAFALLALYLLACAAAARAEEPAAAYIFPAGGQRGTEVSLRVGGYFFHGEAGFEMLGAGVKTTPTLKEIPTLWFEGPVIPLPDSQRKEDYPRDHAGTVAIAADAEPGVRYWRVWTSQGAGSIKKFVVGDLPEVVEKEIDGAPMPVPVQLPVTINGRIFPREDVDIWSFTVHTGEAVTCTVAARSLGSPLVARVRVRDAQGTVLAEETPATGDARLRFTPPADGQYQVCIDDIEFGGLQDHVYRLTITAGPAVDFVYPLGGRRGSSVALHLAGQKVPEAPVNVQLPDVPGDTFIYRPMIDGAPAGAVPLELCDLESRLEAEPNDEPSRATAAQAPIVLDGRIDAPGDVDHWALTLAKGDQIELDLRAARLGSPLDSVLTVLAADGKQVAANDDLANGQTDSRLTLKAPADGVYIVRVAERFAQRGGPSFAYRLHVRRSDEAQPPDFRLRLPLDPQRKQWGDVVTVVRDEPPDPDAKDQDDAAKKKRRTPPAAALKVRVERTGGLDGEIELAVDGLPPHVTVEPTKIPAKAAEVQLKFTADPEAKIGPSWITIRGTAQVDGKPLTRTASVPPLARGEPEIERVFLAVAMPTLFTLEPGFLFSYASAGSVYRRAYRIDRGGYQGPITVRLGDRQARHLQGVSGPTITVPPGVSEFEYPVTLPPWMELGRTSRSNLMLIGEVTDHDGSKHTVSFCSEAADHQIIVILSACELGVSAGSGSLAIEPGSQARVPIRVQRSQALADRAVRVELIAPSHMAAIHAEPLLLPAGQSEGMLTLELPADLPPLNMPVIIRATAEGSPSGSYAEAPLDLVRP